MSPRVRRMSCREVEAILRRYGFNLCSQKGSHRKWRHAKRRLQVIVPEHGGRNLPLGTIRSIFANTDIPESEWTL